MRGVTIVHLSATILSSTEIQRGRSTARPSVCIILHFIIHFFINRLSKWLVSRIKADENDEHHGDSNQPRQCGGRVRRFAIRGTYVHAYIHIHMHVYICVYTRARVKRRYVSILPRWWIPRLRKEKSFDWNQTRPSPVQRILLFVSPRCRANLLEIFSSPIAYPPFFHSSKLHAGTELSSICVWYYFESFNFLWGSLWRKIFGTFGF